MALEPDGGYASQQPPREEPVADRDRSTTGGVRGHHWLVDCADCRCDDAILHTRATLETLCLAACRNAGMQVVGSAFHQFEPAGVTGVVLLAESHLAVHTWPVERFAAIDVYVCNHGRDNADKGAALARSMSALFEPARRTDREVVRDSVDTSAAEGQTRSER